MSVPIDPPNDYDLTQPFKMTGLYTTYTCRCSKLNTAQFNPEKMVFNIDISYVCSDHPNGRAIKVIFGDKCCDAKGCSHAGCNCTEATMQLPVNVFVDFMKFMDHQKSIKSRQCKKGS